MVGIIDLMGHVQAGFDKGRERGQQSYLGKLASQAYGAAPDQQRGYVQQAIATNPDAGFSIAGALEKSRQTDFSQLGEAAAIMSSMPEDQRADFYASKVVPLAHQSGFKVPTAYDPRFQPMIEKVAQVAGGVGKSSELQTFNAMTQGLKPDEVAKARRINLGLEGRASTSGFTQVKFTGPDGRERVGSFNGRTGQIDMPDGTSFNPQTGQTSATQQALGYQQSSPTMFVAADGQPIPPEDQQALMAAVAADRGQGVNVPASGYAAVQGGALPPPLDYQNGGSVNPFVGRAPEEQAAATTAAQEAAKLQFLPTELGLRAGAAVHQAGAIAGNNAQIARDTASDKVAAQRATTLQMYDTAMKGLREGLAGTETGPVVGRIPAFTSGQQIAEGAVAAMAPILKQLFRSAGEGTFTDRDQALLLEMVPKRTDTEAARQAKMENIDAIVRAKLGQGAAPNRSEQDFNGFRVLD